METKKQQELKCYVTTNEYVNIHLNRKVRKYYYSILPMNIPVIQSERPDFIINGEEYSYAIEHFMIDFCYDGPQNNQSQSKLISRDIQDVFNRHHDISNGMVKDEDIDSAVTDINVELNKLTNISTSFDYDKFIEGLNRTFSDHYKKLSAYKLNEKLCHDNVRTGFLIEFHCDTCLVKALYNGSIVHIRGSKSAFPMTKDFVNIIEKSTDLDFVVLSQYNEGVLTEARNVKIFEPNNMDKAIKIQHISVYDRVIYSELNRKINLKVDKNSL